MATMVAESRPVPVERAVSLAREQYGIEASAVALTGEREENLKLTARDGAEYVLKIANPADEAPAIELPVAALLHLEKTDPGFPCPRIVRALDGSTEVRFADQTGALRTARLLTYLPGKLLATAVRSQAQRAACGRMGGRLSQALRGFEHPAARRPIVWDVRHAGYMSRLLEQMPLFPFRSTAADLLRRMLPDIETRLPQLRHQVVHNDLNPRNLLVDTTDDTRVIGVIDFGDITYTALIADVAVAGAELIPEDCADPLSARECVRDVMIAYHGRVPLLRPELSVLGTLAAARLLMTVVVHEWHVHHNPSNRHYAALDPDFMRARLEIADRLLIEDIRL